MSAHPLRVFSYGGGTQSTAALVLAAQGEIEPYEAFLFADVGRDSEHPAVHAYLDEHALPYASAHGLRIEIVRRRKRDGTEPTLLGHVLHGSSRSIPIPVRMANGAPGNRSCTADYKIRVIERWLRKHGATKETPADLGVGFSVDEIERCRDGIDPRNPYQRQHYPLIELGLRREDSIKLVEDAGLPTPPRSSCWFCPFHSLNEWRRQRREEPELFWQSVELERTMNVRREQIGRDPAFLTRFGRPLDEIVDGAQLELFPDDGSEIGCDSGACFT